MKGLENEAYDQVMMKASILFWPTDFNCAKLVTYGGLVYICVFKNLLGL